MNLDIVSFKATFIARVFLCGHVWKAIHGAAESEVAFRNVEFEIDRADAFDALAAPLLGGHASRETREVLTTGVHPMVAKAAADSSASMLASADSGSDPAMADADPPAQRRQRMGAQGFGNLPELTGLAQVVGLALGSPEFQRR